MEKVIFRYLDELEKNGFEAYLVGGYVRDTLLHIKTVDIDICTNAKSKAIHRIFKEIPNRYGCASFKVGQYQFDITTYRREGQYQKRRPEVTFINSLQEDLQRRDFTINAICMDKEGRIFDYLHGVEDLKNKVIRVIGSIDKKLRDDPLRILRAIRLAVTLDFELDKELDLFIQENIELMSSLSTFRMKDELVKMLKSNHIEKCIKLIKKYDLERIMGISLHITNKSHDVYELLSQIYFHKELPFTKKEKKAIVNIRKKMNIQFDDTIK